MALRNNAAQKWGKEWKKRKIIKKGWRSACPEGFWGL